MDFRVKVHSKIQRHWENHLEFRPNLALEKEKKMTSSWHHHFFPTQTRKESAPPMFWMLGCYHFFLPKKKRLLFPPSCADDLEYQSHVTGHSWADKSLHLCMGSFVYLLGVLGRFYLECHLKEYDVLLSSWFSICFVLWWGVVLQNLELFFSCYVDTDLVADEGLPAEFLVDWVVFFN